jgi:hypothetical protein
MKHLFLLLVSLLILNTLSSQIIDSVSYYPSPYVDSIVYWHTIENRHDNYQYVTVGCSKYCKCNNPKMANGNNFEDKFILSEGNIVDNKKDGIWFYYDSKGGRCCAERLVSPKITITYDHGRKVKGEDLYATYYYLEDDSVLIKPLCSFKDLEYSIICSKGNCKILLNGKYLLNEFQQDWLDQEIRMIGAGEYNRTAKLILEKNPPLK